MHRQQCSQATDTCVCIEALPPRKQKLGMISTLKAWSHFGMFCTCEPVILHAKAVNPDHAPV